MSDKPLVQLHSTLAQFEDTYARLDKVRSTSKTVTVDKESLTAILMDHTQLIGALRDHGRVAPGKE